MDIEEVRVKSVVWFSYWMGYYNIQAPEGVEFVEFTMALANNFSKNWKGDEDNLIKDLDEYFNLVVVKKLAKL